MKAEQRPRCRGIPDLVAIGLLLPGTALLSLRAAPGLATTLALVYSFSVCLTIGVSATYHALTWSPRQLMWLQRADFSSIYVLIAGTYTPVCLLILGPPGKTMVIVAWSIAALGVLKSFVWVRAPRWLTTAIYLGFGWMIVPYADVLWEQGGVEFVGWLAAGGVLYSAGAVVYAKRWLSLSPAIWGYHESMHVFVIGAVCCHFKAMWGLLVP